MDKTPAQAQATKTQTVRRSTRKSNPPKRYEDEKFVPGSNNAYTVGRVIDAYDRNYREQDR